MRVRLKKGYQEKLILKAKKNLTWKQLSEKLGVVENYLKNELRKGKRTLSELNYRKLCEISNENFDGHIIQKLDDDWGRSKGGSNKKPPKILFRNKTKKLAELIGIILGDGNIWIGEKGYYYVTICGDSEKDKDYLLNYVKPLFEDLFKKKMHVKYHKSSKEIFISAGSKNAVYTLMYYGLKSGNKVTNNQKIPEWIFESENYLRACIRGLIDTDGSVCPITGRNYHYIWFSSMIPKLRADFDRAMNQLGFKTSKWNIRKNRTPEIFIGSKEMIKKYIQTIGFKNTRHLNKLSPHSSEAKNASLSN